MIIIAIDGLAATGKGTLAASLAQRLNFDFLDSGLLYRKLAFLALEKHIPFDDNKAILRLLNTDDFIDLANPALRTEKVGQTASMILSVQPEIRDALNAIMRRIATAPKNYSGKPPIIKGIVIDGRDIGTVVFPNADCKFFITADVEVRAKRRFKQLQTKEKNIIFDQILQDLNERDKNDKTRKVAPTIPADDAIIIDTSNLNAEEVLESVYTKTLNFLKDKLN